MFDCCRDEVLEAFERIVTEPPPTDAELAGGQEPTGQKWDWTLPDALLRKAYDRRRFDVEGAQQVCAALLQSEAPDEPA